MPNKQRYCGQLQSHVWIAKFRGRNWKTSILREFSYFFVVLWNEGHAKKCVERSCELANKTTQQLYKMSTPCIDDHHFKEEELKSVGELPKVWSQIVLKCLYLARIGRPDILWSLNKLARSITKWTRACDKRLNRLMSYIHHTCEYRQYYHVGNSVKQTGTVSRLRFCGRCWGLKIYFKWNIVRFWKSYNCSNKLDVQETNCCFSQFNRIWNHLVGHWTEIGWFARSGTMGSNCFCSRKYFSCYLRVMDANTTSLTIKSMRWKTLILFLQMSNPRVKKLCCMCLKTTKQWSR